MAKNNYNDDLSAKLAELDEEFGISPVKEEEQPTHPSNSNSKKEPVNNKGISHSFETEEEAPLPPVKPVKEKKEKKGFLGFGKKKETTEAPSIDNEEAHIPKELVYQGEKKKRIFGKAPSTEDATSESNQPAIPIPVVMPTQSIEDNVDTTEQNQSVENETVEDFNFASQEELHSTEDDEIQDSVVTIVTPPTNEDVEEKIEDMVVEGELVSDNSIQINKSTDEIIEEETPIPLTEETEEDFLAKLENPTKKSKKEKKVKEKPVKEKKVKEKPIADPNKKKTPLLNIFLIALIAVVASILLFTIVMKLIGGNDSQEIPISSTDFENAEQISVQKAKDLIESSNNIEDIVDVEEGKEVVFNGGNGFSSDKESPSGLVSLREDTEVTVNSNGMVSYSNSRFGASFEHPPEWIELTGFTSKETTENVSNIVMVGYPADSSTIENLRISLEGTPVSISAKEYFSKTEGLMEQTFNKFSLIKKGETTANGGEAPYRIYQWIPTSEDEEHTYDKHKMKIKQYQIYLAGKEKVYVVTFTAEASVFDKNFQKYNQILSNMQLHR